MWIEQWRRTLLQKDMYPGEMLALVVRQEGRDVWGVSLERIRFGSSMTDPDVRNRFMSREAAIHEALFCGNQRPCLPVYEVDAGGYLVKVETEVPFGSAEPH